MGEDSVEVSERTARAQLGGGVDVFCGAPDGIAMALTLAKLLRERFSRNARGPGAVTLRVTAAAIAKS